MRTCLLVFLIMIFVLLLPPFFFIINVDQIMTPDYIKSKLKNSGAIEQISKNLPGDLADAFSSDASIDPDIIKRMVGRIPSDDLKNMVQSNIDKNLEALADPNAKEIVIDISAITGSLPPDAMAQMNTPGGPQIKDSKIISPIPFQIRFYRLLVNNLVLFKIAGICFVLAFLIFITLAAASWRTRLRAVSLSLFLPGIFIFLPAFVFRIFPIELPSLPSSFPSVVNIIVNDIFLTLKIDFSNLFIWEGVVVVVLAALCFAFSFIVFVNTPAPVAAVKN